MLTGGIPRFRVPGPIQTASSTSIVWGSSGNSCPTALGSSAPGPPGYDRYGQFDSSFEYQPIRRDPFPHHFLRLTVELLLWVRGSEHNSPSKAYPRLSERDSRPPIPSESVNTDRVVPTPRDHEAYLQGLGDTRCRHVCNTVELPPYSVHVSNSGVKSPSGGCSVSRLAGEVNVLVSPIPPAQQSHAEASINSGGGGNSRSPLVAISSWFPHLLHLCVEHPLVLPYRRDLLSQQYQKYISDGKSYHLHVWRLSCDTIKQQAFQTRSRLAVAPRRPSTNCMYDDRWLSLRSLGRRTRV